MKVKAIHKNARMAPRKIRPLAHLLCGMKAQAAESQLKFMPGKGPELLLSTLKSAMANAMNNHHLTQESLTVAEIRIDEGLVMKRWRPAAKGMAKPILKRNAHITVIVDGEAQAKKPVAKKVAAVKTVSADEYVKQEAKAQAEEKKEQEKETKTKPEDEKNPTEGERSVETVKDKAEFEVFQKNKMIQQGGDKKKTHRRKSIG
ncbi:MAG: 50S ribosomal protein L22 [Candidatus Andersenbacteria bacterium]